MKYDDWLERETYLVIDQHCKDGQPTTTQDKIVIATIGLTFKESNHDI